MSASRAGATECFGSGYSATKDIAEFIPAKSATGGRGPPVLPAVNNLPITMKNEPVLKSLAAAITAGVILAFATSSHAAEPRGVRPPTSGQRSGLPSGETVRSATVTDETGQIALSSIDRKWDQTTGTGTLNEASITPDGKIATREANLTRNQDGTITAKGTFTDFNGRTVNFSETTKSTAAGRIVVQGKMFGPDGEVATYEAADSRTGRNQIKRTTVITKADGTKETRVEILAPARTTGSS